MSECHEIARGMNPPHFGSFDEARQWVRRQLTPGESLTVIDNVTWALWGMQKTKGKRAMSANKDARLRTVEGMLRRAKEDVDRYTAEKEALEKGEAPAESAVTAADVLSLAFEEFPNVLAALEESDRVSKSELQRFFKRLGLYQEPGLSIRPVANTAKKPQTARQRAYLQSRRYTDDWDED